MPRQLAFALLDDAAQLGVRKKKDGH